MTTDVEIHFKLKVLPLKATLETLLEESKKLLEDAVFDNEHHQRLQQLSVVVIGLQIALDGLNNTYDYFRAKR